jgi:hypothetical protein
VAFVLPPLPLLAMAMMTIRTTATMTTRAAIGISFHQPNLPSFGPRAEAAAAPGARGAVAETSDGLAGIGCGGGVSRYSNVQRLPSQRRAAPCLSGSGYQPAGTQEGRGRTELGVSPCAMRGMYRLSVHSRIQRPPRPHLADPRREPRAGIRRCGSATGAAPMVRNGLTQANPLPTDRGSTSTNGTSRCRRSWCSCR